MSIHCIRLKFIIAIAVLTLAMLWLASPVLADRGIVPVPIKNNKDEQVGLYRESHALIIGVSQYTAGWPSLPGVPGDVEAVKQALEAQNFHVETVMDPDHEALENAFKDFINRYGHNPDSRLLFYYAGHGHTLKLAYGGDMGYIVPSDAPNPHQNETGFLAKAMDMENMEVFAKRIQAKHALFLFDSCFSGSIFALARAVPENISYKTSKPVRQFITAGAENETVPDESIFRRQFISALNGEGDSDGDGFVTGIELGEFLQKQVVNYSQGSQHPQYGKIRNPHLDKGDFVFAIGEQVAKLDPQFNALEEQRMKLEAERKRLEYERQQREKQQQLEEERLRLEEERQKLEQQTSQNELDKLRQEREKLEAERKLLEEQHKLESERRKFEEERRKLEAERERHQLKEEKRQVEEQKKQEENKQLVEERRRREEERQKLETKRQLDEEKRKLEAKLLKEKQQKMAKKTTVTPQPVKEWFKKGEIAWEANNYGKAWALWHNAAEQGHVRSMFNMGVIYESGKGRPRSYREALKWFQKAAEAGDTQAQQIVADYYLNGWGRVQKDDKKAFYWYQKAAEKGVAEAQAKLGDMYRLGKGVIKNFQKAEQLFRAASKGGSVLGIGGFCALYYEDLENMEEAYRWCSLAVKKGKDSYQGYASQAFREVRFAMDLDAADQWVQNWRPGQ